jgi:putative phosphoribosyl transferase
MNSVSRHEVEIASRDVTLHGTLEIPAGSLGLVLFAHGSGSSRHSPRNRQVAATLQHAGIGTLLFDLLTADEEAEDRYTGHLRFNIGLLAQRLAYATEWVFASGDTHATSVGYFGASTGAAAALIAAANLDERVNAVVSRGGRPDLAGPYLERVTAPTLLIVGERDEHVLELNREAYARMHCTRELAIIPHATHLFEEPGTLEMAAELTVAWFLSLMGDAALRSDENRTHHPPAP